MKILGSRETQNFWVFIQHINVLYENVAQVLLQYSRVLVKYSQDIDVV